jgi:hypothetical protein
LAEQGSLCSLIVLQLLDVPSFCVNSFESGQFADPSWRFPAIGSFFFQSLNQVHV